METLAERIARDGPVNELDAIGWAIRLAKRLEALHVLGVAHGSVSPACILTAGQDRNARAYLADVQHTSSSPAYQSPERILGGDISVADDVWALAATLYALLTGQSPFVGVNDADCRQKILAASPAPLAVYDVGDDDLQHIIDHAFAREVGWRISSVAALRRSLEEWHPDRGVAVLPPLEDEDSTNDDEDVARTMMVRDAGSYLQQNLQIPVSPSRDDDDDDDDNVRTVMRQMPGGDLAALIAKATAAQQPAAPAPAPAPAARPVPQRKATVQGLPPPQAPFSPQMPPPQQSPFAPAPPPQAPPPRMAMPQPQPPPPRPPPYAAGMRSVGQPGTPQPGPPQPPFPQPGQSPYGQPGQSPYGQPPQNPYGQPPQQQAATPPAPPVFASAFGGRPLPPPQPDDDDDDEDEGARTVMRSPEQLAAEGAQDARIMMGKDGAPGPWQQPPGPRPAGGMPPRAVELQGPPTPRTPGGPAPRAPEPPAPPTWAPMNQPQHGGPGPAPTMALPMYEEGNAAYPGAPPLDPRLGGGTNPMGIHGFDPREHDPDMLGGGTNPMGMPGFDGRAPAFLQGPPPPQQYQQQQPPQQQAPQQQPPQQQGPAFGGLAAPGDLSALEGPPGGTGPQVMGGMPSGQYPQSQIDPASAGLARPPARGGRAVLVIAALVALLIAAGLTYFVLRSRMH